MDTKRPISEEGEEILGNYYPVLDHGFISLVDYMGNDLAIDQAARTSYGLGTRRINDARGLIRTLKRLDHTTPFEMIEVKFHVSMPIFVARQWIRHRTANVNEYSGRYSLMPSNLCYTPDHADMAKQSKKNRQGRSDELIEWDDYKKYITDVEFQRAEASNTYKWLIEKDVALELARMDLPLSMYTQWYWKIDLHNIFHFLTLRCDSHAQKEIRDYAIIMSAMIRKLAPTAWESWVDYQFMAEKFSRPMIRVLRKFISTALDINGDRCLHSKYVAVTNDMKPKTVSQREWDDVLRIFNEDSKVYESYPQHELPEPLPFDHFERMWAEGARGG